MKIARLIMTWNCLRNCDLCCNKGPKIKTQARTCRIVDLRDYDQVLITGGEPMLYPERVAAIAFGLRAQSPKQKIFLYTARFDSALYDLAYMLDGIHYILHWPLKQEDIHGFYQFQRLIGNVPKNRGKSFRLYIEPRITKSININPSVWSRLEVKPWLKDVSLPPNEELFQLRMGIR